MEYVKKIAHMISDKKIVTLIFLIALALRCIAVVDYSLQHQTLTLRSDEPAYDSYAVDLLAGKGFIDPISRQPTSWRMPLYPFFVAFIYLIFGVHNYLAVRLVQCILSALVCVFIFYIGKRTFNRKVGLLAAATLAIYRPQIFYSYIGGPAFLLSETLSMFLFTLFLLFVMKSLFSQFNLKNSIIAGILMGLIMLTRFFNTVYPLFFFGVVLHRNRYAFISTVKQMLPFFIGLILVILPWMVRNCIVHKAFVPYSTQVGFVFLDSYNPYSTGGGVVSYSKVLPPEENVDEFLHKPEIEGQRICFRKGIENLRKEYKRLPKLFIKRWLSSWDIYRYHYPNTMGSFYVRIYDIWYAIILMFSLLGIGAAIKSTLRLSPWPKGQGLLRVDTEQRLCPRSKDRRFGAVEASKLNIESLLLISMLLYTSFIVMLFNGDPRFRYPYDPYLIVFASAGIFAIYNTFRNKILSYTVIAAIIGMHFLIYANSDLVLSWIKFSLRSVGL